MSFPDAKREWKRETVLEFIADEFADILDGGILEKLIPRAMVIKTQDVAQCLFEIGEIDDHSAFRRTFDDNLNLICMSVQGTALWMTGKEVRAIDVFGHT